MNTTRKLIAPGYYNAKPVNWGIKTVGEKNTLVAFVSFQIQGGELDGETLTYDGYLTEKTLTRTLENLRVAGFDDNNLDRFNEGPAGLALAADKTVRIGVKEESYNGKTFTRVKGIYAAGGKKTVAKNLLPDIAGTMMAIRAEAGSNAAGGFSDDLPF